MAEVSMKVIEKYVCEGCGKEYYVKRDCERCENNHRPIIELESDTIPTTLIVRFPNGLTCSYKYEDCLT